MGLTSTLCSALSGLNASQARLDVSGNNIANINTVAYKGSRATFQTQLSQTLSFGSPPSGTSGGTNPLQFGLGVQLGAVEKDLSGGSIETTGVKTDVAIEGDGFFVLQTGEGSKVYTRDGAFQMDSDQKLVGSNGDMVLGYAVDDNFNLISGALSPLQIPVGRLSIASATTEATFNGNLDPSGPVSATAPTGTSEGLVNSGGGAAITTNTALTSVAKASAPGVNLFAVGDVITLQATKGGGTLPPATFTVTNAATSDVNSGATVGEFTEWLQTVTGINTTVAQSPPAGINVTAGGELEIVSNLGGTNAVDVVSLTSSGGSAVTFTKVDADDEAYGTSEFTSFRVYDSIGNPVSVNLTFTLVDKTSTGTTWRFLAESYDDSDPSPVVGSGTITFDTSGMVAQTTGTTLTINRDSTGAINPIVMNLDFSALQGLVGGGSAPLMNSQNGFPTGTLNDFAIGNDGRIIGTFSNGLTRDMGQVVLATFSNPGGLIAAGDNSYLAAPNSGEPSIVEPGTLGAGTLFGGALELSNVDLTREFINMITATTAFSASGRVISTSQQLLSELLTMIR